MELHEAVTVAEGTRVALVDTPPKSSDWLWPPVGTEGTIMRAGREPIVDGDGDFRVLWDDPEFNDQGFENRMDPGAWVYIHHTYLEVVVPVDVNDINAVEAFLND